MALNFQNLRTLFYKNSKVTRLMFLEIVYPYERSNAHIRFISAFKVRFKSIYRNLLWANKTKKCKLIYEQ